MINEYVKDDLIFLRLAVSNREELFQTVATHAKNYVTEGFLAFITEREKNYPTGLDLGTHAVAIPHGDAAYIKKDFIAVITTEHPIPMNKMENPEETIPVDFFLLLGLSDGGQHLAILKEAMQFIQQEDKIANIRAAQTPAEVRLQFSSTDESKKE